MKKVVLGMSGGMDSASLLAFFLNQKKEVHCCSFIYGSKHNQYERQSAINIIEYYKENGVDIIPHFFNLEEAFKDFSSNLLKSGGEIPEGHYEASSMSQTVVPNRNMIFASIMAGLAESIGAEAIALGVHKGDHAIYYDCRKEFVKSLDTAIYLATGYKIEVVAPFIDFTKTDILKLGLELKVPYELTRSCYKDQELSCGLCGTCVERRESFENLGIVDPIKYQKIIPKN